MRIQRLQLTNVRCFEKLDLSFDHEGKPRMWTLIAGPNGTGKSTVLRAIASVFGEGGLRGGQELPVTAVRKGNEHATTRATVIYDGGEHTGAREQRVLESSLASKGYATSTSLPDVRRRHGALMLAFGPVRLGVVRAIEAGLSGPQYETKAHGGSLAPLYGWPVDRLAELYSWIRWEDYIRLKAHVHEAHRPSVIKALAGALDVLFDGLATYREVDTRGQILFETADGLVPLEDLADGLRSVFVIVAELLLRLDAAFPESQNPTHEEALCLIDEIDAHLHPRLQRTIVPALRELFPNVQFIATTHSPYVVGSAERGEVVVLRRDHDTVVADVDVPDVAGWTADQIATSSIFGLDTTRDLRGEDALKLERDLLAKPRLSSAETAKLHRAQDMLNRADGPTTAMVRELLAAPSKSKPAAVKKKRKAS